MEKRVVAFGLVFLLFGCKHASASHNMDGSWRATSNTGTVAYYVFGPGPRFELQKDDGSTLGYGTYDLKGTELVTQIESPYDSTTRYNVAWSPNGEVRLQTVEVKIESEKLHVHVSDSKGLPNFVLVRLSTASPKSPPTSTASTDGERCRGNLRALAMATQLYSHDYDGLLPSTGWHTALESYADRPEAFSCPSIAAQGWSGGYAMNSSLAGKSTQNDDSRYSIVLFFETESLSPSVIADPNALVAHRHDGVGYASCLDGTVKPWPK